MSDPDRGKTFVTPGPGARQLAEMFHDRYERLAPSFGYETRVETRAFDPTSKNGRLMIAVCDEILTWLDLRVTADELARLREGLREIQQAALKTWNYSAAAPFLDCPYYLGLIRGTAERCLSAERATESESGEH